MQVSTHRKSEQGFTLVELAIVMIIIGLLIGGILKGQELIANAQIGATVAQVKSIDAATTTFRDKYDGLPGDLRNIATRIPNCTGCGTGGDGNSRLGTGNAAVPPLGTPITEGITFFPMLAAADLLGGVSNNGTGSWGDIYPAAKAGGGFHPGYHAGGALGSSTSSPAGHYLGLVSAPAGTSANDTLTPNQAQRVDTKLDDGRGNSGSVVDNGNTCSTAGVYQEQDTTKRCDLAIRFQN